MFYLYLLFIQQMGRRRRKEYKKFISQTRKGYYIINYEYSIDKKYLGGIIPSIPGDKITPLEDS